MHPPRHERRAQLATRDRQLRELRAKYPHRAITLLPGTGTWAADEVTASSAEELDAKLASQ